MIDRDGGHGLAHAAFCIPLQAGIIGLSGGVQPRRRGAGRAREVGMASVFDDVRGERAALLDVVGGLHTVALERPGVVGAWSVKDVLAHIAGWQKWMLRVLPLRIEGRELPEDLRVTDQNTAEWNRRFVEERRGAPTDKVLEEMADGFRAIMVFAANLGATRLYTASPWPGRDASIADYLREHIAGHDREHREQIAQALERA